LAGRSAPPSGHARSGQDHLGGFCLSGQS